jgi:hypothetical protein
MDVVDKIGMTPVQGDKPSERVTMKVQLREPKL